MDLQSLCLCVCVRTKLIWSSLTWDYHTRYSSSVPMVETRDWLQPVTMVPIFCGWSFSRGLGECVNDTTGLSIARYGKCLLCACLCTGETLSISLGWGFKVSVYWCNVVRRLLNTQYKLSKKKTRPFFRTAFQRYLDFYELTAHIFIVKGLNTVSHACSMNHKQLMNMHLWNGH